MAWFSTQWNKLQSAMGDGFGDDSAAAGAPGSSRGRGAQLPHGQDAPPVTQLTVVWGRNRLSINLPSAPPATLGILKAHLTAQTGVPYEELKLISNGFILRDERLPLGHYGLRDGSKLTLVSPTSSGDKAGSRLPPPPPAEAAAPPEEESEASIAARIDAVLAGVTTTLLPDVEAFCAHQPPPSSPSEARGKTQKRLAELLLRALLKLDGISVPSEESRKKRKEAVGVVQKALDRVDAAAGEKQDKE